MEERKNINDSLEISLEGLERRRRILSLAGVADKRVLDVGAGPLGIIAARDYGCDVTAIDTSQEKIEQVKAAAATEGVEIKFDLGDATNMPYGVNEFDAVIVYGTLHHLPQEKRIDLIAESFRVAGETLVVAEFNKQGFERIHPDWEYPHVDLDKVGEYLSKLGVVEKHVLDDMEVYVCRR